MDTAAMHPLYTGGGSAIDPARRGLCVGDALDSGLESVKGARDVRMMRLSHLRSLSLLSSLFVSFPCLDCI